MATTASFAGLETMASGPDGCGGGEGGGGGAGHKTPVVLDPIERVRRFGIETIGPFGDGICFRGGEWTVGGEYVQKLTVKNVSRRLRKLKYKLPEVPYFTMVFPELINLSPGMHVDIDVVFRPVHNDIYNDTIYFKICDSEGVGGFHVPCRALISTLQASIPAGLDFGLCPTNETMKYEFQIKNKGEVPCPFEFKCPLPFLLEPMDGIVPVGEAVRVTASIFPTDASVFVSLATCEVGRGVAATKPKPLLEMRLSAIGRYTYIVPSEDKVDFGTLLAGQTEDSVKEIVLRNQSSVPATVRCMRVEIDREPVFEVRPTEFVIPPQSEMPVHIDFDPVCAGCYTMEHFKFTTPGGNETTITVSGMTASPRVDLYKKEDPFAGGYGMRNSLNFRDVHVGRTNVTALFLRNDSELPVHFMFVVEENGCFKFSQVQGVIPAQLEISVRVEFTPLMPTNYYQRVFCIFENALPLFVDLLGTGYISPRGEIKEQRPAPLRHAHVQAFRNRCAAGLAQMSPPMLLEMLDQQGLSDLFAKKGLEGTQLLAKSAVARPVTRSGETTRNSVAIATEFFKPAAGPGAEGAVYLDKDLADFGYVSVRGAGNKRSLTLFNTTHGKVAVQWVIPGAEDNDGQPDFDIVPRHVDIGPGRSQEFQFLFRPSQSNFYYCQELECYVFFKNQRTFRLVNDALQQPPWCIKLKGVGHTLPSEQFAAQVCFAGVKGGVVEFPACHVGDQVFRTLRLVNHSNLPAQYLFEDSESTGGNVAGTFEAKPRCGIVPPGSFQLVQLRFMPPTASVYRHLLSCVINHEEGHAMTVSLKGEGTTPALLVTELEQLRSVLGLPSEAPAPPLYMKATCTGLVSSRTVTVVNPTRIPVIYSVEIPARMNGIFAVSPRMGLLRGNQSAQLTVSFAPWEHKEYHLRIAVRVRALAGPPPELFGVDSRMIGEAAAAEIVGETHISILAPGSGAVVRFDPPRMNFGTLLVNTDADQNFVLVNESDCDVQYELFHVVKPPKDNRVKPRAGSALTAGNAGLADVDGDGQIDGEEKLIDNDGDGQDDLNGDPSLLPVPPLDPSKGHTSKGKVLCVDRPKSILPAHSRTTLKATFTPLRAREFEVEVVAFVSAVDANGLKVPLRAEESAQLRVGDRARLVSLLTGTPQENVAFDEATPLPLSATIVGQASFPTIIITDARTMGGGLGGSTRQLWSTLGLEGMNYSLAQPLTAKEVKLNLDSSPDPAALPLYPIRFIPNPIGSPNAVVSIRLTNPGYLTTSFEIHFPNEREIEVPQWADEGEPTMEQLKENRIIDELKCFDVFPREGTLGSGESREVTFTYRYDTLEYEGKHDLIVHLKINQGKQFRLKLTGETLSSSAACLWQCAPPTDMTFRLQPVAIGTKLEQAPLQSTELVNTGEADLDYSVDVGRLPPDAYPESPSGLGFQNMFLENPTGTIPARSTHYLQWRFLPLEVKEYLFDLPLTLRGGVVGSMSETLQTIKISGMGYDPRQIDPHADAMPAINSGLVPPPYQLLAMPTQVGALSLERISLGRLPQRTVKGELFVLRNPSRDSAMAFQWEAAHPLVASGVVSIEPMRGVVEPGRFVVIKLTVVAKCAPCIADTQIAVLVRSTAKDENKSKYHKRNTRSRLESRPGTHPKGPFSHDSIVSRRTASRSAYFRETTEDIQRMTGREPSMPSKAPTPPGQLSPTNGGGGDAPPPSAPDATLHSGTNGFGESRGGGGGGLEHDGSVNMLSRGSHRGDIIAHSEEVGRVGMTGGSVASGGLGASRSEMGTPGGGGGGMPGQFLHIMIWFEVVSEEAFVQLFSSDVNTMRVPRPRGFIAGYELGQLSGGGVLQSSDELLFAQTGFSGTFIEPEIFPGSASPPLEPGLTVIKLPSNLAMAEAAIGHTLRRLFRDLLNESEVRKVFAELPIQPKIPLYHEMAERASLPERLTAAFALFDLDHSGTLTGKELKAAVQKLGLKARTSEVKEFMRSLDSNADGAVDLGEFLCSSMPPEVSLALEDALETMEHEKNRKVAEERRQNRLLADAVGVAGPEMTPDKAALSIQGRLRTRNATRKVALKKELAESAEAREEHAAAARLQGLHRAKLAKQLAKERAERKEAVTRQMVLSDPDFQGMISDMMESTMRNLLSEVLHGEFNLHFPPKQYTYIGDENPALPPKQLDPLETFAMES